MSNDQLRKELSDLELTIKILSEDIEWIRNNNYDYDGFGVYWTMVKERYTYRRKLEWVERCIERRDMPMRAPIEYALKKINPINLK